MERLVRTVFCNGLNTLSREGKGDGLVKLRHENALLLHVRLLTHLSSRIELGCTDAVAVSAAHLGGLFCDWTNLCHCPKNVA